MVYSGKLYMVPVAQKVDCCLSGKSLSGADSPPVTVQWVTQLDSDSFDCVTCSYGFSSSILATHVSSLDLGHVYSFFYPFWEGSWQWRRYSRGSCPHWGQGSQIGVFTIKISPQSRNINSQKQAILSNIKSCGNYKYLCVM